MRARIGMLLGLVMLLAGGQSAARAAEVRAATLPPDFLEVTYAGGLDRATAMAFAPDGRLFVTEQDGALRVIQNGALLPDPFLTLSVDSGNERGLLGVTFDPDFATNQYVYLYYTVPGSPPHNRVSRFTANGNTAVPGSEVVLLNLPALNASNHNGGALHFGPDGALYIAVGDNANGSNSQSLTTPLGKILRIAPDGSIPVDNPFYASAAGQNRAIWALGLRNPYTFAFQPGTGRMFINDVGQAAWEEINEGAAGANFGWPNTEGDFNPASHPTFTRPLFAYDHDEGCAITGGAFYNPSTGMFPAGYTGQYFFADYCGDWIRVYDPDSDSASAFLSGGHGGIVDLRVGPDGALYYLSRHGDAVYRVVYLPGGPPVILEHPADLTVSEGQDAAFHCTAAGSPAPTYQWQRDGADLPGATGQQYTLSPAALSDDGAEFICVATNAQGSVASQPASLTVLPNDPPVPAITAPAPGLLYRGGQEIRFSGAATDTEDGTLPPDAFTWQVDFHHDAHTHPFIGSVTGREGKFRIPSTGETSANVWYRLILTVTDSAGAQTTVAQDIFPQTADLTLQTSPAGLGLLLDDQPVVPPLTFTGVVGIQREIAAPSPQMAAGSLWAFDRWADSSAAARTITTPSGGATYTALFVPAGLVNPSFELDADANGLPDAWKLSKREAGDGVACDTADDGLCSLRMGQGLNETLLRQKVRLRGEAGDPLVLHFAARGQDVPAGAFVLRVIVSTRSGNEVYEVALPAGTTGWADGSLSFAPGAAYKKITVLLIGAPGGPGAIWLDDLRLALE